MKIELTNKTGRPDEEILPLIELAAQVVTVSGLVRVTVGNTKRRKWGGYARYSSPWQVSVLAGKDEHFGTPIEITTLGYFRQHAIPLRKPYTYRSREDVIVGVAAHEFAHLMKRGHNHRKSVIELFCEEKCADAIELFQSEVGQLFVKHRTADLIRERNERESRERNRKELQRAPETKRDRLIATQKRWETKAKRAANALKKIRRQLSYLDRRIAANAGTGAQ